MLKRPLKKEESLSDSIMIKSSNRSSLMLQQPKPKKSSHGSYSDTKIDEEIKPIIEFS